MAQYPFFIDIPIVAILMLALELVIMRRNYRLLSPNTLFIGSVLMLYILPYFGEIYIQPHRKLRFLSYDQFQLAFTLVRQFFYTWCLFSIYFMTRLAKMQPQTLNPEPFQTRRRMWFMYASFFVLFLITLGVGVGFNPIEMFERAINPRAYTHIKTGVGPIRYIRNGFRLLATIFAVAWIFQSNKSLASILTFASLAMFTMLGGSKATVVAPFVILVVMWQMLKWSTGGPFKKFWHTMLIGFVSISLVLSAFMLLGRIGETQSISQATTHLYSYQKECYYLPLVVERFDWSPHYVKEAAMDSIIAPIPRKIWPGKPVVGLWTRYFKPAFEPNTVEYHVSTFGCLAEAHMLFGWLGPWIYGFLWALLTYKGYQIMIRTTSWFKAFIVVSLTGWIYLLARTGFTGTNFAIFMVYMAFGYIFIRGMITLPNWHDMPENRQHAQH